MSALLRKRPTYCVATLRRFVPKPDSCTAAIRILFDHLVGDQQYGTRNFHIEQSGGLEIDDKLVFGRLLDGKISRFCTIQNLANIDRSASERVCPDITIRHEPAGLHIFFAETHRRQLVFGGEFHNKPAVYEIQRARGDKKRIGTILSDRRKRTLEFTRLSRYESPQRHVQGWGRTFQ